MGRPTDLGDDAGIVIANEFAGVRLRIVQRRTGQVLEVYSPRRNSTVVLDAAALDLLAGTPIDAIVALSRTYDEDDVH